jgi:hypothetical protein
VYASGDLAYDIYLGADSKDDYTNSLNYLQNDANKNGWNLASCALKFYYICEAPAAVFPCYPPPSPPLPPPLPPSPPSPPMPPTCECTVQAAAQSAVPYSRRPSAHATPRPPLCRRAACQRQLLLRRRQPAVLHVRAGGAGAGQCQRILRPPRRQPGQLQAGGQAGDGRELL